MDIPAVSTAEAGYMDVASGPGAAFDDTAEDV